MPKRLLAILLVVVSLFCIGSTTAFAQEPTEPLAAPPVNDIQRTYSLYSDQWTLIYTGDGKVSAEMTVRNTSLYWTDIRMVNFDGKEVWYQYHTMAANAVGQYHVGHDVEYVYLRVSDGRGAGSANVTVVKNN